MNAADFFGIRSKLFLIAIFKSGAHLDQFSMLIQYFRFNGDFVSLRYMLDNMFLKLSTLPLTNGRFLSGTRRLGVS